ncbi:MAG: right-handed parallel beta-helix repeat-containing protein [Methanomicrobia archaeon]|nr:right-handed parallel beta-helix repeat-containing protein [Methanomicrobia archaeon]
MDMKKNYILIGLILTVGLISGCTQISEYPDTNEIEYSISNPPDLHEPEPIYLPETLENKCMGGTIAISSDTDSARFENCIVTVKTSGIKITRSEFINTRILFESVSDIVFADNVVRDYPTHEEPAVNVYDSEDIVFRHNHVKNNSIGVSVAESMNIRFESNIFDNNYQHNAIAMYKSSGEVFGNLFRYNFPHGILVHFIPEHGETTVHIHDNIFFMNIEDAINFEDWTNAEHESKICNNIITKTAWAGINIEYNSWNANILIENNYINESGYPIEKFPNASDEWDNGWGHGIKLEDCSGITIKNNTILDNNENGIDIRNCRNVILRGNTVTRNDIGIFVGGPDPYSFTRDVSPLSEENAGSSVVIFEENYVFKNNKNVVEEKTENETEGND